MAEKKKAKLQKEPNKSRDPELTRISGRKINIKKEKDIHLTLCFIFHIHNITWFTFHYLCSIKQVLPSNICQTASESTHPSA